MNRKLVLADGTVFPGKGFGATNEAIGELVFNTSMAGYQEIMSDKSYGGQAVVMTYPLIGTYGINDDDYESAVPAVEMFIVKEYQAIPSNFRFKRTFGDELVKWNIPGIEGIDTRMLTRHIRDKGSQNAIIVDESVSTEDAIAKIKAWAFPVDIVTQVARNEKEVLGEDNNGFHIVAIDHGIKMNIINNFLKRDCKVTILPYGATAEQVMAEKPDGMFLSNGPGDPEWVDKSITLTKELQGKVPIFGICLGHQIIALANGAKTYKMKFGHRGGNHAVKHHVNGKVEITTQNHSFAVEKDSLEGTKLELSHTNILDGTIEGFRSLEDNLFCVQYHPESTPGPQDSEYLFDIFVENMKGAN